MLCYRMLCVVQIPILLLTLEDPVAKTTYYFRAGLNISSLPSQTNVHIGSARKLVLGVYHAVLLPVFRPGAPAQMHACTVTMVHSRFNLTRITCVYCTEAIRCVLY